MDEANGCKGGKGSKVRRKRLTEKVLNGLWMGLMHAYDVMSVDDDMWPENDPRWLEWEAAKAWIRQERAVRRAHKK